MLTEFKLKRLSTCARPLSATSKRGASAKFVFTISVPRVAPGTVERYATAKRALPPAARLRGHCSTRNCVFLVSTPSIAIGLVPQLRSTILNICSPPKTCDANTYSFCSTSIVALMPRPLKETTTSLCCGSLLCKLNSPSRTPCIPGRKSRRNTRLCPGGINT